MNRRIQITLRETIKKIEENINHLLHGIRFNEFVKEQDCISNENNAFQR